MAHAASKKIVFIEERYYSGTCSNRGCAPNDILDAASHALGEIEIVPAHAVTVGKINTDETARIDSEQAMISSGCVVMHWSVYPKYRRQQLTKVASLAITLLMFQC